MHSSNSLVKEAQGYSNTKAIYMCHRGFTNGGGWGGGLWEQPLWERPWSFGGKINTNMLKDRRNRLVQQISSFEKKYIGVCVWGVCVGCVCGGGGGGWS